MEPNLSRVDRTVRIAAGVLLVAVGVFALRGIARIGLAFAGAVLIFSGTVGFCHVYKALGVCTLPKR